MSYFKSWYILSYGAGFVAQVSLTSQAKHEPSEFCYLETTSTKLFLLLMCQWFSLSKRWNVKARVVHRSSSNLVGIQLWSTGLRWTTLLQNGQCNQVESLLVGNGVILGLSLCGLMATFEAWCGKCAKMISPFGCHDFFYVLRWPCDGVTSVHAN